MAGDAATLVGAAAMNSALYFGRVTHTRALPAPAPALLRRLVPARRPGRAGRRSTDLPGFAVDRPGPISFHTRDHGPRDGSPLRPWIERYLDEAGIDLEGGAIRILCFPRVVGYVFNPLSVWFCHHRDGSLRAILYEVSNTFGEQHGYLVPVDAAQPGTTCGAPSTRSCSCRRSSTWRRATTSRHACPTSGVSIAARETVAEGQVLTVALTATREPLTSRSLARAFFGYPLVTLKVIGGIHWEALKLWIKGAPYRRRGAPPAHPVTILAPERSTARVA